MLVSRASPSYVKIDFYVGGAGPRDYIGAVYIAATGVKMWSNGQDTFLGGGGGGGGGQTVKQYSRAYTYR